MGGRPYFANGIKLWNARGGSYVVSLMILQGLSPRQYACASGNILDRDSRCNPLNTCSVGFAHVFACLTYLLAHPCPEAGLRRVRFDIDRALKVW